VALFRGAFGRGAQTRAGRTRLRRNADAIEERFRDLALPAKRRPAARGAHPSNIEAVLRGRTKPAESIIVAARYASLGGPSEERATGIAALVALARILRASVHGRTIRLVALEQTLPGAAARDRYLDA